MLKYSQPEFYKFSEDSTQLANLVIKDAPKGGSLLDICCGSGIVGIEISKGLNISRASFVEKQSDFKEHIELNLSQFSTESFSEVVVGDFIKIDMAEDFDIIVMNPPYFNRAHHRISPNRNKDICRAFDSGEISALVKKGLSLLSNSGSFYIVLRDNDALKEIDDAIKGIAEKRVLKRSKEVLFLRLRGLNKN